MDRRLLALVPPVVAIAAVAVLAVVTSGGIEGKPTPDCINLAVYPKTDDEMRKAVDELRADPRVLEVVGRTKAESFEEFKRIFANQPELLELAREEAIPASVEIEEVATTDRVAFADELRAKYGKDFQYTYVCGLGAEPPTPTP